MKLGNSHIPTRIKGARLAADVLRSREADPPRLVTEPFIEAKLEDGYDVQLELTKLRLRRGDTQIGYKVGCTSKQTQAQLGIHAPVFGRLFIQDKLTSPQTIHREDFDGLGVEGELAVLLDRDPRELPKSPEKIASCITQIFPVIELHHMGLPTTTLNATILVGNNAIHAGFVYVPDDDEEPRGNSQELTIRFDGKQVATIPFSELERTIFDSLTWLRQELVLNDDTPLLTPPVIVLCGTVAPLFRITESVVIDVTFNQHAGVRCEVL